MEHYSPGVSYFLTAVNETEQGILEQVGIQSEMVLQEQEIIQAEMGLQEQELIETGLSLQEKEFQAEMNAPEPDIPPQVGLQGKTPPVDEAATPAALPLSSPEGGEPATATPIPAPTEPEKPPVFVVPDIEMEEGELEDEKGHEQQTTLAQDKIQILTKDVSIRTLKHAYISFLFILS